MFRIFKFIVSNFRISKLVHLNNPVQEADSHYCNTVDRCYYEKFTYNPSHIFNLRHGSDFGH